MQADPWAPVNQCNLVQAGERMCLKIINKHTNK